MTTVTPTPNAQIGRHFSSRVQRNLLDRVAADNRFYTLAQLDGRVKDIDHRVADDVHGVASALLQLVINGVQPLLRVAWFTYRVGAYVSFTWPAALFAYYFFSLVVLKRIMPDYRELWRRGSQLDSSFKKLHARLKTTAESVAFFNGGARERQVMTSISCHVLASPLTSHLTSPRT
jgi:ABC-type uncharacterized transport system fused permease/ATPase subunit